MLKDSVYKKIRAMWARSEGSCLRRSRSILDGGYIVDGQRDARSLSFPIVRPQNGPLDIEKCRYY